MLEHTAASKDNIEGEVDRCGSYFCYLQGWIFIQLAHFFFAELVTFNHSTEFPLRT